jgi:endogenous inhibitor of DNA gyrase (YacG/DUF329 family)
MTNPKPHPDKQFTPTYGVWLAYMEDNIWYFFCPYCFTKVEWKDPNEPPRHCTECGKSLRTRLAVPKKEEK